MKLIGIKYRSGYVSNSSSSSFIIHKEGLTEEQLNEIRNYVELIDSLGGKCGATEFHEGDTCYDIDEDIKSTEIFQFWIDDGLYDSDIVKFFIKKYGKNVEDLY